ncbi:MAG: hypothetical protein AUI10_08490 [Actinobacteria bacterium 13_2_20CM_2_72_6]|nr:MAG: hypothetical protein AUI10_08490 [Actinobacteria bacterium 13_2_20CM_2_72_6]
MAGLTAAAAGPFLARLLRLDPGAVVRLRPAGEDTVALWARLPWGVLATRRVPGASAIDVTVGAGALLSALTEGDRQLPPARDRDWRWALPPSDGTALETLPATTVERLGAAAADTLRARRGAVGDRMLRDALLDHVPIVVSAGDERIPVRQGLVQAMLRMAFMSTDGQDQITVRISGAWVGLAAEHGSVWLQNTPSLAIQLAK